MSTNPPAGRQQHHHHDDHAASADTGHDHHESSPAIPAAVVTASDGVSRGTREDRSGDELTVLLGRHGFDVGARRVVPDERSALVDVVEALMRDGARLVVVTGGTGLGPRDVTPEALDELGGRVLPGFGEVMRATGRSSTPLADLSRSVAIAVGATLVVAVPGSPSGAVESLAAVIELVPHALDLLAGDTAHAQTRHPDPEAHTGSDDGGHDHGDAPVHGAPGHVHDDACATAHGEGDDAASAGTLMAVFASPLAALLLAWGRELGWDTVLVDPRVADGSDPIARREVDGMVVAASTAGADSTTDVVVTDHHRDELVDLLDGALGTEARFIGLMGSKRHEGPHVAPLRELGRTDDELARIVRPIGIDIGSRTPAEIAVSTLADLVARRRGRR